MRGRPRGAHDEFGVVWDGRCPHAAQRLRVYRIDLLLRPSHPAVVSLPLTCLPQLNQIRTFVHLRKVVTDLKLNMNPFFAVAFRRRIKLRHKLIHIPSAAVGG